MNIDSYVNDNRNSLVEAIRNHLTKHVLDPWPCELRLYPDMAGTTKLKSESGISNQTSNDKYYVLCRIGGSHFKIWDIIGNVFYCLQDDEEFDLLEEIKERKLTKSSAEKFIEERHPELLKKWLKDYDDYHYYDEMDYAEELLETFLDDVHSSESEAEE